MLQRCIFLILLFYSIDANAQNIEVSGTITDVDGDPVPNVSIYFDKSKKPVFRTSSNGKYSVNYDMGTRDSIFFKSIAFDPYAFYLGNRFEKKALKNGNRMTVDVVMPDKTTNLIVIRPNSPDTLIGSEEYSIQDFEFTAGIKK